MKRLLCTSIVMALLLTACSVPAQQAPSNAEQDKNYTYDIYELVFSVENVSGSSLDGWDVVYTCNDKVIESGYQVLLSVEVFTFYSVRIDMIERENPDNTVSATFPVAICNGGSGKTELTVIGSNGQTATFKVTCKVMQVGKQ